MQPLLTMPQVWTFEDLQAIDVEDWRRYEIVDGALVVSPSTGFRHEVVSALVREVISAALPPELIVVGPMAVDLAPSYRIPDLLVVPRRLAVTDIKLLRPADLPLVVEVVSPGSVTTDRITKPAQYAAAGIGAYWWVETKPEVSLTAYVLREGANVYTELGTWTSGQIAQLIEPFTVEVTIDRLTLTP